MDFDEIEAKKLTNNEALAQILHYEKLLDELVKNKNITQEKAWDGYFGLLHECDERGFLEERERIVTKIDTKKYNPFQSEDFRVRLIARLRMAQLKISSAPDN
ncbi:MAG: hypothetical protein UV01_C0004G0056 [Parcubacteria group bacterium GW2011_GWA2_42_14]|nr:MAG: hypothetical protein UV01_C0004G0056 [Parcubacteria group bacterium GW2011_GWA2_42_14]